MLHHGSHQPRTEAHTATLRHHEDITEPREGCAIGHHAREPTVRPSSRTAKTSEFSIARTVRGTPFAQYDASERYRCTSSRSILDRSFVI